MEIAGVILIILVIGVLLAYFRWSRMEKTADVAESGAQAVTVIVSGAYSPNVLRAKLGKPLTIVFDRQEGSACSKKVIFADFGITANLQDFGKTEVKFTPDKAGEFGFSCEMGMYQGKLIVEE